MGAKLQGKTNTSTRARSRPVSTKPWKQSLRAVPRNILEAVSHFASDAIVVACVRRIPKSQVEEGVYAHLGIHWNEGKATFPAEIVPDRRNGRYSSFNIDGRSIRRVDLPMITRTYSVETPNYGDWSLGSHEVSWDRQVYQRDFIPPRELAIKIELVGEEVQSQALVLKFTVDEVLDRRAADFGDRLLFNLNLLQENVGNHGVFESAASLNAYLKTLFVNWEILPPGERDENIAKIFRTLPSSDPQTRQQITQRYDLLARLKPERFVRGTNGLRNYFGAQFAPDLVVFENVEYGNAVYVMFEDWTSLSQKSRTELLADHSDRVVRIPHTENWQRRLVTLIKNEKRKRRLS
jgi:hypothetical protein